MTWTNLNTCGFCSQRFLLVIGFTVINIFWLVNSVHIHMSAVKVLELPVKSDVGTRPYFSPDEWIWGFNVSSRPVTLKSFSQLSYIGRDVNAAETIHLKPAITWCSFLPTSLFSAITLRLILNTLLCRHNTQLFITDRSINHVLLHLLMFKYQCKYVNMY